jgi:hypothetical protein
MLPLTSAQGNPRRHRPLETPEHGGFGYRRDHKEYFSGEAALKAGGAHNTMNQFG